jgi:hypothetical protein
LKIDLSRFSGRFRQETRDNLTQLDSVVSKVEEDLGNDSDGRDANIRDSRYQRRSENAWLFCDQSTLSCY